MPAVQIAGTATGIEIRCYPTALSWPEVWQELVLTLRSMPHLRCGLVTLAAGPWPLTSEVLQALLHLLSSQGLRLERVITRDRDTAIAAAGLGLAVQPESPFSKPEPWLSPLYLDTTLRSGKRIEHSGNVVLRGDVNPGGEIIAQGDILIWGRLRGVAHAGAAGNEAATIMALSLHSGQIRIAAVVARLPETKMPYPHPEMAYLEAGEIHLRPLSN